MLELLSGRAQRFAGLHRSLDHVVRGDPDAPDGRGEGVEFGACATKETSAASPVVA